MSVPSKQSEVVLVHPEPPARPKLVRAVRSTLVCSGLVTLRKHGLFDRYAAALGPQHLETARSAVAGTWLLRDFMLAHYAAWDSLGLTNEQVRGIGLNVAASIGENMLLAIKHLTTGVGVTPWTVLGHYPRLWGRAFDGGGVRIDRAGPKDAVVHLVELPFVRSAYFRGLLLAIHEQALGVFATKLIARVVPSSVHDTSLSLRLAWV